MLFPYHLSDVVVKGLRITPFQYYIMVLEAIMQQERSYDSLPNFTAVDNLNLDGANLRLILPFWYAVHLDRIIYFMPLWISCKIFIVEEKESALKLCWKKS